MDIAVKRAKDEKRRVNMLKTKTAYVVLLLMSLVLITGCGTRGDISAQGGESGVKPTPQKINRNMPDDAPLLELALISAGNAPEQHVRALQLGRSWSVAYEDGTGRTTHTDSAHSLQVRPGEYEKASLLIESSGISVGLIFSGDYPPQALSVQRWNAVYNGGFDTDVSDIWDMGEPVSIYENTINILDNGSDYIYEVYARWEDGYSYYAFRVESGGAFGAEVVDSIADPYAEYSKVITRLTTFYGEAELVRKTPDKNRYDNISETDDALYLSGVCIVELIDFTGDGTQDLFIVYSDGQFISRNSIPRAETYKVEVWTVRNGSLERIIKEPAVSSYSDRYNDYWNPDCCFVTVYGNSAGLPGLQVYKESDTGCTYTNIYFSNGAQVRDELVYDGNALYLNGSAVQEDEWDKHVGGYDLMYLRAELSCDKTYSGYEYSSFESVIARTKMVVSSLMHAQPEQLSS